MRLIVAALGALAVAVAAPVSASAKATKRCSAGSTRAVIAGQRTCLKPGESCLPADNQQYVRFGYICEDERGPKPWLRRGRPHPERGNYSR
jgi:hypothetical protein